MSLADILMQLQSDDRYGGDFGRLPQPQTQMPTAMPPPMAPPQANDNSALMAMAMAKAQGGNRSGGNRGPQGVGPIGGNPSGQPQDLAWEIAKRLERKGFQVGGLEGFQGTDPTITSGHIDNSQHYSGMAGDVTYGGNGRWNNQNAALDWAERMLQRRFGGSLTELLWQEPDHYDHLHYGTRPGG